MVSLERLTDKNENYELIHKWCSNKEVYTYFEQRILSYNEIKNKYYPRTKDDSEVPVYFIVNNHEKVGIIQYTKIDKETLDFYNINNDNAFEIDIFIGKKENYNKGIGSKAINILCDKLYSEFNASIIVMCPIISNLNAIRCYEKCGFKKISEYKKEDTIGNIQTYLLMIKYM